MCTTDDEVCRLRNMFCKIKYIVFKIKILTVLLLSRSFGNYLTILQVLANTYITMIKNLCKHRCRKKNS